MPRAVLLRAGTLSYLTLALVLLLLSAAAAAAPPSHPFCSPAAYYLHHPQTPVPPSTPPPSPQRTSPLEVARSLSYDAEHHLSAHRDALSALKLFRLAALLGHSGAHVSAASLLLIGAPDLPRDFPSAIRHLRHAAKAGHPDANALLSSLHFSGLLDRHGIRRSVSRTILYAVLAARAGSIPASSAMGFRHLYAVSVPRNCRRAGAYYRRAASAVATNERYWPTALNFVDGKPPLPSSLVESTPIRLSERALGRQHANPADSDIVHYYRHSAERGNTMDRTTLGALHLYGGHGIEPDEMAARQHLRRAADAGNGEALGILGHMDMRARKNKSAEMYFRRSAAQQNSVIGHYALGMMHKHGLLGHSKSYSHAAMHFELALEGNEKHPGTLFELGMIYWFGRGRERSLSKGYKLFERAAKAGHLQSKLYVGIMMLDGTVPGKPRKPGDCPRVVRLLKEVAEQGDWRTALDLAADELHHGDWYGALHRYLQAAHVGIELAQYNAAFLLEKAAEGRIPELAHWPRDKLLSLAHDLYELSARQGHTKSLIRSGDAMYLENNDFVRAAGRYRLASTLQNAEGMVSLGIMHARGLGVARDRHRATQLLLKARQTDTEAEMPAVVALIGLNVAWFLEDLGRSLQNRLNGFFFAMDANKGWRGVGEKSVAMSLGIEDALVIGGLVFALVMVLVLRSKRMARQTRVEVTPGP